MPIPPPQSSAAAILIQKVRAGSITHAADCVAVEEPLEIRLGYDSPVPSAPVGNRAQRGISVTMRTPGHDAELAAGFLLTEGIITSPDQIQAIRPCVGVDGSDVDNVIRVELKPGVPVDLNRLERHFFTSSSCGICGKTSIDAIETIRPDSLGPISDFTVPHALIHRLPDLLRDSQSVFDRTGGLHAAALFDRDGALISLREDVGRHNALDKLIGSQLLAGRLPLIDRLLMLSGRASFELIQKAMMASIPLVAAVGAPSSLAVQLAVRQNMTLLGFVRQDRFNIYSAPHRLIP